MKPRGRPQKTRQIKEKPKIGQFSPRGRPGRPDEVELTLDQYEALRLADYRGRKHEIGAKLMGISRQTFGRILKEARKKLADGVVNGKIIRIEGGKVEIGWQTKKLHQKPSKSG
ncbi:MAG: DUF134 domain-containing protein [Candidatus Omnitrophica bacterium]|nr:DUF134 domain-containing protein [Candidatus Omnitrophota bacterium]